MRKRLTNPQPGAFLGIKEPVPLMTVKEAAHLLRVTTQVLYRYCQRGTFSGVVRIGNRRILIEREKLMEWIKQGGTPAERED